MTLHEDIASAAQNVTGELDESNMSRISVVKKQVILEFLKWIFFFSGVIGILGIWVAYDNFLSWIGSLDPVWGSLLGFFSIEIVSNFPVATPFFMGSLILGCVFATLQKHEEVVSRAHSDEAANILSELSVDFGETKEVLHNLDGFRDVLNDLSIDMSEAKEKLLIEAAKKKQINESLKEAKGTISSLRRKVRELTKERESLKKRLKMFQQEFNLLEITGIGPKTLEKLRNIGIFKASDLLKMAPEDLADKTGISPKLITKWLEDAAKLSINT